MVVIKCCNCNKDFSRSKYHYDRDLKKGKLNFFCSLSCSVSFQGKRKASLNKEKYYSNPKLCKNCNAIIKYESHYTNSFCGHSCSAIFNNPNRILKKKSISNEKINSCIFCGKDGISFRNKYCSSICKANELKIEAKKNAFLKIESNQKVDTRRFKQYIIEKRGHKCEMCGLTEWGGKSILLILDHIDGNSNDCRLENLRVICSNCDTLTPTYKGRNRGNGRFARKQRYQNGKSF